MLLQLSDATTFEMPDWQECVWRRIACGQMTCTMCTREAVAIQKAIDAGIDPDSMEAAFMTVHDSFAEVRELISKDAQRLGIDLNNLEDIEMPNPPKRETYPIYKKVRDWHKELVNFVSEQSGWGATWFETEAGKDLLWYKNTLLVKTARALNGRWSIENGEEDAEVDYLYTKYVIAECVKILKLAFEDLRRDMPDDMSLMLFHSQLAGFEQELVAI